MKFNSRAILWLNANFGVHLKGNTLSSKSLADLSHSIQLVDGLISHHADTLRPHVLQVHADLLRHTGAKPDGRSSHLKGVLLLAWVGGRRGILALVSML